MAETGCQNDSREMLLLLREGAIGPLGIQRITVQIEGGLRQRLSANLSS